MFLLLLTGVGPLIAWRKSSFDSLRRAFLWPTVAGVAVAAGLLIMGVRSFYALVSFGLCTFVLVSVTMEFVKGANAIKSKDKTNFISSVIELTHRNTRRYGGYLVHVGVVIIFIGFTGKAFDQKTTVEIQKGDTISLGKYQLQLLDVQQGQNDNYRWQKIIVDATRTANTWPRWSRKSGCTWRRRNRRARSRSGGVRTRICISTSRACRTTAEKW